MVDGRRASTILRIDELCSRSGGDAREAMTVGCKPTTLVAAREGLWSWSEEGQTCLNQCLISITKKRNYKLDKINEFGTL